MLAFIKKHSLYLLAIMHLVGLSGLLVPETQPVFQSLTPFNLCLSACLLLLSHPGMGKGLFKTAFLVAFAGYLAEVIGVKTGFPFGDYRYGAALGWQVFSVPLVIGANWFALVYGSSSIAGQFFPNPIARSVFASLLMVFLDFFIEPVAIKLDFWIWDGGNIPLSNYIGWFGVSFLLNLWFGTRVGIGKPSALGAELYAIQLVFFVLLGIFLK